MNLDGQLKKSIWLALIKFGSETGSKVQLNLNWSALSVLIAIISIVLEQSAYKIEGLVLCLDLLGLSIGSGLMSVYFYIVGKAALVFQEAFDQFCVENPKEKIDFNKVATEVCDELPQIIKPKKWFWYEGDYDAYKPYKKAAKCACWQRFFWCLQIGFTVSAVLILFNAFFMSILK